MRALCPGEDEVVEIQWTYPDRFCVGNMRVCGEQWLTFMQVPWEPIAEDIERIFTLFVLQSAKRQQIRRLAKCVQWGVIIGTLLLITGMLYLAVGIGTHVSAMVTGVARLRLRWGEPGRGPSAPSRGTSGWRRR